MQEIGNGNSDTVVIGDRSSHTTLVNRIESVNLPQLLYLIMATIILTNIITAIVVGSMVFASVTTLSELEVLRAALETPP
jgi:predicted permease